MKRGILFRKVQYADREIEQLVLPSQYRNEVLNGLHNDVGHPGTEITITLMRERSTTGQELLLCGELDQEM